MSDFSMGEAWSRGMDFLRANFVTILLLSIVGTIIPLIIQFLLTGSAAGISPGALTGAGADPTALLALMGGGGILASVIGSWFQYTTQFAAYRQGLRPEAGLSDALSFGAIAGLLTLLLIWAVFVVFAIIFFVVAYGVLQGMMSTGSLSGAGALGFIIALSVFIAVLYLVSRFSVAMPLMADERNSNPLFGFGQSWRMTQPFAWKIVAYFVLLGIAAFVIMMVLGALMAAIVGSSGSLTGAIIIGLLVSVPMMLFQISIPAGIYRALRPDDTRDVFA